MQALHWLAFGHLQDGGGSHEPCRHWSALKELFALAQVLRRTLLALDNALGNPDFNYLLHSAPAEDETKRYYLWHIQFLPRVTTIAGFELGSGMYITTVVPEESAAFMRDIMARMRLERL
ncbi:MAG: hypothetical protein ACRERE_03325 [Candidatus Entotheonellia bacterium]